MDTRTMITASEIGEFVYCKRAWWLRINEHFKENQYMLDGREKHEQLARSLRFQKLLKRIVLIIILLAVAIVGVTAYLYLYG